MRAAGRHHPRAEQLLAAGGAGPGKNSPRPDAQPDAAVGIHHARGIRESRPHADPRAAGQAGRFADLRHGGGGEGDGANPVHRGHRRHAAGADGAHEHRPASPACHRGADEPAPDRDREREYLQHDGRHCPGAQPEDGAGQADAPRVRAGGRSRHGPRPRLGRRTRFFEEPVRSRFHGPARERRAAAAGDLLARLRQARAEPGLDDQRLLHRSDRDGDGGRPGSRQSQHRPDQNVSLHPGRARAGQQGGRHAGRPAARRGPGHRLDETRGSRRGPHSERQAQRL